MDCIQMQVAPSYLKDHTNVFVRSLGKYTILSQLCMHVVVNRIKQQV